MNMTHYSAYSAVSFLFSSVIESGDLSTLLGRKNLFFDCCVVFHHVNVITYFISP